MQKSHPSSFLHKQLDITPVTFSLDNSPFICYSILRLAAAGFSVCGIRLFRSFDLGISPGMFPLTPLNAGIEIPGEGGTLGYRPGASLTGQTGRIPDTASNRQAR